MVVIFLVLLGVLVGVSLAIWFVIFSDLFHKINEIRNGRASPQTMLASRGGMALQVVVVFVLSMALVRRDNSVGGLLLNVLLLPVFAPFAVVSVWSKFFSFLAIPSLVALLITSAAIFTWLRFVAGWGRAFWPTVAVTTLLVTLLIAGEIQFYRDVRLAAGKYEPDCLDAGSFMAAVLGGSPEFQFDLHAAFHKGADMYAWSFRQRDFYKLPETIVQNVSSRTSSWFAFDYPRCR